MGGICPKIDSDDVAKKKAQKKANLTEARKKLAANGNRSGNDTVDEIAEKKKKRKRNLNEAQGTFSKWAADIDYKRKNQ